jgi:hypothetical protein
MTWHRQRSIRDVVESKVMDVMGFKPEPFHERFVKDNPGWWFIREKAKGLTTSG